MLRPQVVNRDAFIKNFSSLWKGKEDVSIKEMAHNWFWVPSVCDHDRRRVLDVEPYAYRRSLVLLVRFDVDFPLISLTSITFPETGERLIEFKYKYLPEYCFACGKLGHSLVSLIIVSVEQGGVASVGCVLMVLLDRRRRPALRGLPSLNRPNLIFLVETLMTMVQMRGLVTRLGSVVGLCVHLLMVTRVTRFYNYLDPGQCRHSWELLRCLSCITTASWLCCGDFNEVSSIDEKNGSRPILKTPRLVEPLGGDTVFTLKSSGLRMRNVVW
ncbi:unnamed protein product [Prunus armeniaca]